jgi:hypothetical protein
MNVLRGFRFLKKTVINRDRVSFLGVAVLFFVMVALPSVVHGKTSDPIGAGVNLIEYVDLSTERFETVSGTLYYKVDLNRDVDGCDESNYFSFRYNGFDWDGTDWGYYGGGGSTGCTDGEFFAYSGDTVSVEINDGVEGYTCTVWAGTGNVGFTRDLGEYYLCAYYNPDTEEGEVYGVVSLPENNDVFGGIYNTKFLGINITDAGNDEVNFDATYTIDSDEIKSNVSKFNPTSVLFQWSKRPEVTSGGIGENIDNTIAGTSSVEITVGDFEDGIYDLNVKFTNGGCSIGLSECPFSDTYIYTDFTIASGTLTEVGDIELYDSESFLGEMKYGDCGLTSIDECLMNVVIWTFVPPDFSIEIWESSVEYLYTKIPFVYVKQFYEEIQSFETEGSGAMPTVAITVPGLGEMVLLDGAWFEVEGSPLKVGADLLRVSSAALFYFALIIILFKRTRKFVLNLNRAQLE